MGKVLIGVGAIIAAIFVVVRIKAMRKTTPVASIPMGGGTNVVDEAALNSLLGGGDANPIDNPGGTFLGNSSDTRSPINVIKSPGSTLIKNNPVLEWSGNTVLPGPPNMIRTRFSAVY